ncbi:MAG: hypothetical protein GX640_04715 [Fibrobacter sp.]|nr:hypothetical protein [Fibrobacter sp.]
MFFLIINVLDTSYKEEIFLALQSSNITMASYFSAKNPDTTLTEGMPLLSSFFSFPQERSNEQMIITALIDSKIQAQDFINILKEADIDIDNRDIIRLVVLPVEMAYDRSTGLLE